MTKMVLKNGAPMDDLRFGSSKSRALCSQSGEINANDKKELFENIGKMLSMAASGDIRQQTGQEQLQSVSAADKAAVLASALSNDGEWRALGSSIATKVDELASREGILRRVAQGGTPKTGEMPRVQMPVHNQVTAVVASSSTDMGFQRLKTRFYNPPEFEIKANVRVTQMDLDQISGDLLDQAYQDGLEAIMVKEDRLWREMANKSVGAANPLTYIGGTLTPRTLADMRNQVAQWNLPTEYAIMSNDFWSDIAGAEEWHTCLDPISKYDLVLNGQLGMISGMTLITDGFRDPSQVVLKPGEIFVVSNKNHHAAYTTRGGVRSTPTDGANSGNTDRGWLLHETMSLIMPNARSVAKGQR